MIGQKVPSVYKGMSIAQLQAKQKLQGTNTNGVNYTTVAEHNTQEGQHNFSLQKFRNYYQGLILRKVELPHDTKNSQADRQAQWNRQSAMPWGNQFMRTPTDANRLNNPSQQAFVSQRQLATPNSYQQFYAFTKALSAAFGTIRSSS